MSQQLSRLHQLAGSGRLWMWLWIAAFVVVGVWCVLTVLFWMDSVRNLNALSIAALFFGVAAGVQATLGMRKADPEDEL